MKKVACSLAVVLIGSLAGTAMAADAGGTKLIIEGSDLATFGTFKYDKSEISVDKTFANPKGSIEVTLGSSPVSIGVEGSHSENNFDGTYENSNGNVDVKRNEFVGFLRFGRKDNTNIRFGFRKFKYDFSNAHIFQYENGVLEEEDRNGSATGDLATGADVEITLAAGSDVQFALTFGGTYFKDAKYSWTYDKYDGNNHFLGTTTGSAQLDAFSARLRPQISFKTSENLRFFVNGTLAASTWNAKPDGDPDYPGVDIYMAVGAGAQLTFSL